MSVQAVRPIDILLVEDDAGDVIITREALEEGDVPNRLNVVGDGVEAMDYLRRTGRYDDAIRPDLVLLDLNLPRRNGRAVLAEVKADPDLRRIPIIVLTTSNREDDVRASYDLHANAYVTKPVDFDRFVDVVRQVDDFYVSGCASPPPDGVAGLPRGWHRSGLGWERWWRGVLDCDRAGI
jgi:CheY-like chemotaxis protein